MGEKLAFRLLLIRFQGGIEDRLKVVGGACIGLGHDSSREGKKSLVDDREREDAQISCPICTKETAHSLRPDFMI